MNQIRIALCGSIIVFFMFLLGGGASSGASSDRSVTAREVLSGVLIIPGLALPQLALLGLSASSKPKVQAVVTGSAIGLGIASLPVIGLVAIFAWLDAQFGHHYPLAERALIIAVPVHIWLMIAGFVKSRTVAYRQAVLPSAILAPIISLPWIAVMLSVITV